MVMDGLLVAAALYHATFLRPLLNTLPFTREISQPTPLPLLLYLLFPIAWVSILLLLSVYDGRRNLYFADEIATLTLGGMLAAVSLAGTLYLSFRDVSRVLFLTFVVLAFVGQLVWRIGARIVFRRRRGRDSQIRRVLIVGAGPVGRELQDQINRHPDLGLRVEGLLDDDPGKRRTSRDILGTLVEAREIVDARQIDDVVIALPRRAYERVNRTVADLHTLPVKVWVIPDYFHLALHKATVEEFAGIPMLDLRAPALNDYQRLIKRAFDLTVTCLLLPVALPLMGLIAIAISLDDRGAVLLRQKRVGENGRLFDMLKFRTMVPEAESLRSMVEHLDEHGHLIHKIADDPRVTRVGRVLRRTSLDELPQLINVLKGEMSLVGPRPELPYLVKMYEPWQHKRFAVPQGLTGWWQVNGRSDKPMHLHTEEDLYYVHNYSLLLDVYILMKTAFVVFRGRGAY